MDLEVVVVGDLRVAVVVGDLWVVAVDTTTIVEDVEAEPRPMSDHWMILGTLSIQYSR